MIWGKCVQGERWQQMLQVKKCEREATFCSSLSIAGEMGCNEWLLCKQVSAHLGFASQEDEDSLQERVKKGVTAFGVMVQPSSHQDSHELKM